MTGLFSLVISAYDVAPYLDDFLASLAAQTYPVADLEIIFVDDGSTDASADIIASWIDAVAPSATLLRKENGGLSSARNAGLGHATGSWVTFCDPDDVLSTNYFSTVAAFITEHDSDIDLVATRLLMLDDGTRELRDEHPLRFRFEHGNQVVDLERDARYFHLSAASGFYRTEIIDKLQLRFDERIRPNFEDGHFTGLYLANFERPHLGIVPDAAYHYRRRRDASSLVQDSWSRREKFTTIPRFGYLDLFAQVQSARGAIPIWLQNLVLYDVLWYLKYDERIHSLLGNVDDPAADEFHAALPEVMRYIDSTTIDNYHITSASAEIRQALIIGAKGERLRPDRLRVTDTDPDQQLSQVRYFFGGEPPHEEYSIDGQVVAPVYGKHRSLTFVGRRLASERIVWLPSSGEITASLDGFVVPVEARPARTLRSGGGGWSREVRRNLGRVIRWGHDVFVRLRGWRYSDAWVFIDRNYLAQDNAEHLCRHVIQHHPEINAWFVVDRDTADWSRLTAEGFRLVQYGTSEHRQLMLNCTELISSQVDDFVVDPIDVGRFGRRRWRFTFLQHGITKDDLSRWLNRRRISCFVTATDEEFRSIAGDDTPYVFTDKEVRLTGLPRHDRLLRLAEGLVGTEDRLLLVMPTWRRPLVDEPAGPGGNHVSRPGFWETTYARNWLALLSSERLRRLAERARLRIAFVPHPTMTAFHTGSELPPHIDVHRYQDVDIQEILVRGAALITDYSSNAFELAYLHRPVVYFQFDRDWFFSGQHVYRRGAWSYEHDGFGPVATSVPEVLDELERLVAARLTPQEPYATRMLDAFVFRDGQSCERVVEAILSMRRPSAR